MKGISKILLGLAGAVVILLVLAAVVLPLIYDKDDLKRALANEVREQTGRELSIDGPLDFSVFPWLAVEVSDLSLSNAKGFGDQPFARIGQARVGVALMPLFRKQIAADEITLDGLELALAVDASGRNNWDDLAADREEDATAAAAPQDSLFSSKRVAGLNIREARIDFQDQAAGSHYRLSRFSVQTGALGDDQPVPLALSTLFEDLVAGTRAGIELTSIAAIDLQTGQYTLDDFNLALDKQDADATASKQLIELQSPRISANLTAQTLQIERFEAALAGLEASGTLAATDILDDPAFSGSLETAGFSPSGLMQKLQGEAPLTTDPDALQNARLSAAFSGNSTGLTLDDIALELDQSLITGQMSVRHFDPPKIGFELAVDQIDLDRYLEPASDTSGQESVAMPQEELHGQEIEGRLSVGKLKLAGLNFSDARIGVSIVAGKLRLSPLAASFYGGTYNGDITLDSSAAVPMLSLDEKIESVSFQQMLADLVVSESLSGTALGHLRLNGRGSDSDEILGSLNGDLGLSLAEGALEGINVWYEIRRGMALYKGLEPPPAEPNRTVFSRLKLAATVDNGVVSTRELLGELPFLTLSGKGKVNLGQSIVDLDLLAAVRNAPELAKDPLGAELRGKSLPFKVSGPLDNPSVSLDFEALLKSEAADMLLKKLGVVPATDSQQGADGEQQPASTEDQLKKAAEGALFDLLRGKDKEKDKEEK
jgi:AsmA protein